MNPIKVSIVRYPDRRSFVMRFTDPVSGKQQARSTGTVSRREAERVAAKWEAELHEGRFHQAGRISWDEFRDRYETEKLASLSSNTFEATSAAFNHIEKLVNPRLLSALTPETLSRFQAALRKTGIAETSIATHLRHLRASLSWAVSMGLLPTVPSIQMPKRARGLTLMRGRPISTDEFAQMLKAAETVRPRDSATWQHFLTGLFLSGLRLGESTVLSWDDDAPIAIDLTGRRPRLRIYAEAEKGHQDRLLPITPDFARFLMEVAPSDRSGLVFRLNAMQTGAPISVKRISRVVSAIGRRAGVIVNKATKKFASAHDLRRSFGTRWAGRVKPATLQLLMRHESIETTLKYYVAQDADEIADELWESFEVGKAASGGFELIQRC